MSKPGRPRSADVERRILAATLGILEEEGMEGASIEAVARRAKVGKTSIYRRWPNLGALIIAAMNEYLDVPVEVTGDLRGDLLRSAGEWARLLRSPLGRGVLLSFLSEKGASRELRREVQAKRYASIEAALRAAGENEIEPGLLNDLIGGTILYRILAWDDLDDAAVEAIVDAALAGSRKPR